MIVNCPHCGEFISQTISAARESTFVFVDKEAYNKGDTLKAIAILNYGQVLTLDQPAELKEFRLEDLAAFLLYEIRPPSGSVRNDLGGMTTYDRPKSK